MRDPQAVSRSAVSPAHPPLPTSHLIPEIGPSGCPLCGGWMWVLQRDAGVIFADVAHAAPPASAPTAREVVYRCNRCRISCRYWMAEDGTQVALERR